MTHSSTAIITPSCPCGRKARLVQLPLVGRSMWLCHVCGPARMIAVMRSLVAHGVL